MCNFSFALNLTKSKYSFSVSAIPKIVRSKSFVTIIFPTSSVSHPIRTAKTLTHLSLTFTFAIFQTSNINLLWATTYPATVTGHIVFIKMPSLEELYICLDNFNSLSVDLSRIIISHFSIIDECFILNNLIFSNSVITDPWRLLSEIIEYFKLKQVHYIWTAHRNFRR
jgi:hypothetical protein